jgi:hypothetical protein
MVAMGRDVTPVGSDLSSVTGMLVGTLEGSHGVTLWASDSLRG